MKVQLICQVCKKPYLKIKSLANKSKYCSKQCAEKKTFSNSISITAKQVILTGIFGDGCLFKNCSVFHAYRTNSKYKEYILFKQQLLQGLTFCNCSESINQGYKKAKIYSFQTQTHPQISEIAEDTIENNLNKLTELGLALWFYDDGSLHCKSHFYNLSTHKFKKAVQEDLFIPFLKEKFGIVGTLAYDRKQDGRIFTYLRFNKRSGHAQVISDILTKYYVDCYKYKIIGSETIPKGSREEGFSKHVAP